ncbi:MAG: FtsH protease activity modulator HflK [bacterium]|nr:FtsH protease activity modulator HflK [bacterium]
MAQDPFGNQVNIPRFETPKLPPGVIRWVVLAVVAVAILSTSFYQVEPDEVGVVLRLGVHIDSTPPGLHFKLPFFIDRVTPIPVQRQLTEEFGFETPRSGVALEFARDELAGQSNMLTGDLNAAVVEWVVQYRIVDPVAFLFKVRNAQDTFRDMSEAVMREAVGDRTVNEVITIGRQELSAVVLEELQELNDLYETGIQVEQVVLQDVTPPDPVQPAFNEVNEAEQEKSKLISQAQSEYNKVVPRARGEAQQTILAAEGYALDRVNRAQGEAARFVAVYNEYRKAPEVTRRRIYLETVRDILPKVGRKIVVDDEIRGVLPLLNLDVGGRSRPAPRPSQEGGS